MGENEQNIQSVGAGQQQAVKSKRDIALERLKARHPDTDYADDEAVYGAINDDYDADQKTLGEYKKNEEALGNMFKKDPRSATFLQSWQKGGNPIAELVRTYGDEFLEYMTDPEKAEEIAAAQEEYLKKVAEGDKLEEEYNKNMLKSLDVFDEFEKEYGEETTNVIIGKLMSVANDVIQGKFTKDALEMFRLAADHDKDVADAAYTGEVKGRNANIDKNLRLRKKSDGTADLDGKNADVRRTGAEPDFGALGRDKRSIWDAGNERRIHNR